MGGFARGATPLANGPRHCGQPSGAVAQPTPDWSASAGIVHKKDRQRIRRIRQVIMVLCVFVAGCVKGTTLPISKAGLLTGLPKVVLGVSVVGAILSVHTLFGPPSAAIALTVAK